MLGCGALKLLGAEQGEIKSMRTTPAARGRGIAALILSRILDDARQRHLSDMFLETGSQDFFAPARRLYRRHGFTECPPFADYTLDPHSVFLHLGLTGGTPGSADLAHRSAVPSP